MLQTAIRRARAPGRVNLIGDHTDYNGGVALPMAIDLGTQVLYTPTGERSLTIRTDIEPEPAVLPPDILGGDLRALGEEPGWARLAATLVAQVRPRRGGTVEVTSTLPVGVGLSSSASFCVALALALGWVGDHTALARLCQRVETLAGAPVGLMDPLVISAAREGTALLIDFADLAVEHVALPGHVEVLVVDSGEHRMVGTTAYAERRRQCEAAARLIGSALGAAGRDDLAAVTDPLLQRRARHVVTECERVRTGARLLAAGDVEGFGRLMTESHRSLAGDFEVSTPTLDALVDDLCGREGVLGARLTGAGFGGCVVALCRADTQRPSIGQRASWLVRAAGAASVETTSPAPARPGSPGP